jgi:hypothetical protein
MANKVETFNLEFTAKVGTQNRAVINPYVAEVAELIPGDLVTLVLVKVQRRKA